MKSDIYLIAFCFLNVGFMISAFYYLEWWVVCVCIATQLFVAWQAMVRINTTLSIANGSHRSER